MSPALRLSPSDARRFHLHATGLIVPHASVGAALDHHGYVQIDPINVCGRMHDLMLRNRVASYAEGDLFRHLHGSEAAPLAAPARCAFEHHLPSTNLLVAMPLDAWPFLRRAMRMRAGRPGAWSGRLTRAEKQLAPRILDAIATRGPLASEDIEDAGKSRAVWGAATLAKTTMQKLFFHGELLIAGRDKGRRRYDLPERVLPPALLRQPEPAADDVRRWEILLRLRQRRLVRLKRNELPWVSDAVQAVTVGDGPVLHLLRHDLPALDTAAEAPPASPRLLAPLDPLIYDRALTRQLWAFDYTWEVYTPAAKRVRGYYALPVLSGERLVGHVDPKADRTAGRLRVVTRKVARGHAVSPAIHALALFLGLRA